MMPMTSWPGNGRPGARRACGPRWPRSHRGRAHAAGLEHGRRTCSAFGSGMGRSTTLGRATEIWMAFMERPYRPIANVGGQAARTLHEPSGVWLETDGLATGNIAGPARRVPLFLLRRLLEPPWRWARGPLLAICSRLGCAGNLDWPPVMRGTALQGHARPPGWDLVGFGQSERPAGWRYRPAQPGGAPGKARLGAESGPLVLVGHSMGGTLAVLLAECLLERAARSMRSWSPSRT